MSPLRVSFMADAYLVVAISSSPSLQDTIMLLLNQGPISTKINLDLNGSSRSTI